MSQRVRYLTHPEVEIDPAIPVGQWHLNARGRARAEAFAGAPHLAGTVAIYASREAKAIDTAAPIAATLSLTPILRADMGENDRTATGFLPGPEFETTADAFFANPDTAIRGWETARAAQARIVAAAEAALAEAPDGDVLLIGHGAVGTLLYCHLAGLAISRAHDQPKGGGNVFAFERISRNILHPWLPMEIAP